MTHIPSPGSTPPSDPNFRRSSKARGSARSAGHWSSARSWCSFRWGLQPSSDPRAAVARPAGIKSRPARARAAPSPGSPVSLRFARQWPDRMWAVEGANGVGRPVAQRLLAGGERVLDVPAKLAARARVFDTGQGRKTDATDAHAVVIVALRDQGLGQLSVDGSATARHLSKGAHRSPTSTG